jgi:hypothetical protein
VEELLRFYLHTAADAREQALHAARELVADAVMSGRDLGADAFLVADQNGEQLTFVPMTEALPKRLRY